MRNWQEKRLPGKKREEILQGKVNFVKGRKLWL